jgi:hypothetical protein
LRRWTRVRRSNLRCFFLAIRLRRFLITEPINNPNLAVVRASRNPTVARNGGLTRSRAPLMTLLGREGQAVSTNESRR